MNVNENKMNKITILEKLKKSGDLPPFPDILIRLQKQCEEDYVDIDDIARILGADSVLAGSFLKLSNSAYYKRGTEEITSLSDAIAILGITVVKHIAFSMKFTRMFTKKSALDNRQFWRHSIGVAIIAKRLATLYSDSSKDHDTAYLSGLMHDIGVRIFMYLIPKEYTEFLKNVSNAEIPVEDRERKAFGISHQSLGAIYIQTWWEIDEQIVETVRNHHFSSDVAGQQSKSTLLVNIADWICNHKGFSNGIHHCQNDLDNEVSTQFGLTSADIQSLLNEVDHAIGEAEEIIGY